MPENIETKVAQTILQQPEEITVGDKVYKAAPPSAATLILASEAVARMPKIQLNTERIVDEVLAIGKDCRPMGEIVAIMILGAKGLTETRKTVKTVEKRRFWGLIKEAEQVEVEEVIDHKTALAKSLLEYAERTPQPGRTAVTKVAGCRFFRAYHFPDRDKSAATDEGGGNDSIWAVIAGTVKGFNLPLEYVLYDMSYANMIMYGAVLPSYKKPKDGKKESKEEEIINASDPRNRDKVHAILFGE